MANITLTNLPTVTSLSGAEPLLGVQSSTSVQITTGQIVSLANGAGGNLPFPVSIGGTGDTSFTQYALLYGNGTSALQVVTPPTGANYILVASPGSAPAWQENIPVTAGVNSVSLGTTGLTPTAATEGDVTIAFGSVPTAAGIYSPAANQIALSTNGAQQLLIDSTGAATFTTSATSPLLIATASRAATATTGAFSYGTNGFSDTNVLASFQSSVNSYNQVTIQNTSSGTASSAEFIAYNNNGTASTNYAAFGINSSGYTGTGSLNAAGYGFFTTGSTDLVLGTVGANAIHFVTNSASTDAMSISSAGVTTIADASITSLTTPTIYGGTTASSTLSLYSTSGAGTSDYISFLTGSQSERMRIRSDGGVVIGGAGNAGVSLYVQKDISGAASSYGIYSNGQVQSGVTTARNIVSIGNVEASASMNVYSHYYATEGVVSGTITNQYGFQAATDIISATTNYSFLAGNTAAVTSGKTSYGFYSSVNTATGGGTTWGFYGAGTAQNAFAGDTRIGSTVAPTKTLDITGTLGVSGAVTLSTPLPVSSGGTGASTANAGLTNLTTWTTTATAGGTTVLTNTSTYFQFFTGTLTQTITLPVTSTLGTGWSFHIVNNSTGNLTVNSSGGNLVITVLPGLTVMVTCIGTTLTTAADWEAGYTDFSTATGTGSVVLSVAPTLTGTTTATTLSATTLTATAGAGFQNMVVLTSGASYSLPAALQVTGAKFKITVIGGGGAGGGNPATAATAGGGGGAGGVAVAYLTYVAGQNSITTSFGAAGAGASGAIGGSGGATTATYNALTYIGTGGAGGALGAATSAGGAGGTGSTGTGTTTLALTGQNGGAGGTTTAVAGVTYINNSGGNTPLGWGNGGLMPFNAATGVAGNAATNYGAGGSGSVAGSTATARAGGNGTLGAIIIEY